MEFSTPFVEMKGSSSRKEERIGLDEECREKIKEGSRPLFDQEDDLSCCD